MEELIASKREDISNMRKALYVRIMASSDKYLEEMLKSTISARRNLEKIDLVTLLEKEN